MVSPWSPKTSMTGWLKTTLHVRIYGGLCNCGSINEFQIFPRSAAAIPAASFNFDQEEPGIKK